MTVMEVTRVETAEPNTLQRVGVRNVDADLRVGDFVACLHGKDGNWFPSRSLFTARVMGIEDGALILAGQLLGDATGLARMVHHAEPLPVVELPKLGGVRWRETNERAPAGVVLKGEPGRLDDEALQQRRDEHQARWEYQCAVRLARYYSRELSRLPNLRAIVARAADEHRGVLTAALLLADNGGEHERI